LIWLVLFRNEFAIAVETLVPVAAAAVARGSGGVGASGLEMGASHMVRPATAHADILDGCDTHAILGGQQRPLLASHTPTLNLHRFSRSKDRHDQYPGVVGTPPPGGAVGIVAPGIGDGCIGACCPIVDPIGIACGCDVGAADTTGWPCGGPICGIMFCCGICGICGRGGGLATFIKACVIASRCMLFP